MKNQLFLFNILQSTPNKFIFIVYHNEDDIIKIKESMTLNKDKSKTLSRMKILTELHGAPGFEDDVKSYLKSEMSPYVDDFVYNRMGGFYGVKRAKSKNSKKIM